MNSVLAKCEAANSSQMNKVVIDGNAKDIFKLMPEYLDKIFRGSIKSLNPNVNLRYVGYRRCTPDEEFDKMVANEPNKIKYDIASSDIYLCEFLFNYNGEPIPRYIYLPYAQEANILRISGTKYHVTPVLSDTVLSPSYKQVFARLLKDKLTFQSKQYNFIKDKVKEPGLIIYTSIIKNISGKENTDGVLTPLSIYILGKYGFKTAITRYAHRDDVVFTSDAVDDDTRSKYHVYESTKIKPKSVKDYGYLGHDVKILVNKKVKPSVFLENFIWGILYALDAFPNMAADAVKVVNSNNSREEILFWRILLGRISYKSTQSVTDIVTSMTEHFDLLEGYLDSLIQEKLAEANIYLENFYDLLAYLDESYTTLTRNSREFNSDLNNRYIDMLYYILYDIIIGFNKMILAVNKRATKKLDISIKEISKLLTGEMGSRKIFSLVKSSQTSLAILQLDSVNDIKYPKVTSILEDQNWSLAS